MHIRGRTLDDLLRQVFSHILRSGSRVNPTKGDNRELFGVVLELTQPLARLSRTETKGRLFSSLGELLWYLAGSDELSFIEYYVPTYVQFSDDGRTIWGAYGPRLFNMRGVNQFAQVRDLLKCKQSSRRAVIQLFNAEDICHEHADIPCTCTMQFMVRRAYLHMFVSMRSNDAYIGLPHDVFAFTMIQELLARDLGVGVGRYKHAVGSLHLYDIHIESARHYLDEGWQSTTLMPPMPKGDPWPAIDTLKKAKKDIRKGIDIDVSVLPLDDYWKDMAKLLKIYALTRRGSPIDTLRKVVCTGQQS
jgi:thymidylate synthase